MAAEAAPVVDLQETSCVKCFGGHVKTFTHNSPVLGCAMTFSAIIPPQAEDRKVPVLYWLSGLTCNEQNFITKAGAHKAAMEKGIMIICPDTSPRGVRIPGDDASWDFGLGAGFYVDATVAEWSSHYKMYSYITSELPEIVLQALPARPDRVGIFGHSMGGHGALVCALRTPSAYTSVSAFAPICHPSKCPWGVKAFTGYLGPDQAEWAKYDATELAAAYAGPTLEFLIDQGTADKFLKEQLLPMDFVRACSANGSLRVTLREQQGYDHGYYFITTFVEDHIAYHAHFLNAE